MNTINRYEVSALSFPVDGYTHIVRTLTSVDGGKTFYYCGNSKYFRTEADAAAYKAERENKFELFICCLGNGLTVCNKAVEEDGDYKQIAHISEYGKITWYVNPSTYVPGSALLRIEHDADAMRANWETRLEAIPLAKRYGYLLDQMPHAAFMHVTSMTGTTEDKCEYMKKVLYTKANF